VIREKLRTLVKEYSERNKRNNCSAVYSVTNSHGFMSSTDYFSKEVFSKDLSTYKIVRRGMIAYNPSRINVGSVAVQRAKETVIVSPLYVVFSVDENKILPEFLTYFLHSDTGLQQIAAHTSGSVRDSLKFGALQDIEINLYSIEEQREIIAKLQKVDDLLECQRTVLKRLDDLVKSQFIEMFGSVNKAKYPVMRIGAVAKLQGGYAFKSTDYMSNGVPIVQIANVNRDNLDWNEMNCVPAVFLEKYSEFALNPGDLVMAMTRPVIKSLNAVKLAVVSEQDVPCLLNQRVGRFRIERTKINRTYLMSCCQMQDFKDYVVAMSGNSLQPNISSKQVENYSIVLPPIELQNKFAAFVKQTDKSKFRIKQSLEKLEICYKALLQKYFG